jgi:hypothetical protein
MPLRIRMEGSADKPVVVCDHCGAPIDGTRPGHFSWRYEPDGTPVGEVCFTHQDCTIAFTERSGHPLWCSKDLECLPVYVLQGLGVDWNDAEKKVRWLDSQRD